MDIHRMGVLTSTVQSFLYFLGVLVVTVQAHDGTEGNRWPFKPPCPVKRMEITFPHVIDVQSRHVKSEIPGSVGNRVERSPQSLPDAFFLEFSWRRQKIKLVLYRTEIAPPGSFTEWDDDNVTYAEVNDEKCYYHGYVKGHRSSYTAVSTCSGVAGYAQTDDEILFIEPSTGPQRDTGMQAHLVYTCEDREPASDTHQWAPQDYDDAQMDAHWRKKRAARRNPKYLEIFMAVAPSTVNVVGKSKVKNYIMTLLNIVNQVYQHSSLGVDIRVALVRLDFLNERTTYAGRSMKIVLETGPDGPAPKRSSCYDRRKLKAKRVTTVRNAYQTVRNFCEWAMYLYKPSNPQTHDIAVLLTREDLGPAGYAPITGMCNPIRSCAAIKDEGFTSAFIIAHEMAHVFGLFHDGHGNRCHGREYRSAIMATLVESKLNHYWWSICSQERMKAVVDYLYCLNDDPFQLEGLPDVPEPIGKSWSLNQQCILEFGEQFTLCRAEYGMFYSDSCNMLWCGDYRNPHLCRTKRGPPLPGTPCGRDRECVNGQCQYKGTQAAVHGQWGYWSQWTPCSSECGVGIRYRSRKCDNPSPKYGGRDCDGGKDEMGTCINDRCETYTDKRELECQVWEEMNIRPGRHTWKPYPAQTREDRCKQTCISDKSREVVTVDIQTEDGTPCSYEDDYSICVLGTCYNVGCDGIMNSTKKSDTCGVCGGDNSFCKTVTGEFLRKPNKKDEYEQVLFLPHGARNVEITKTKKSPHFLALKDPERGGYYINGNGKPEPSKKIVADGALFNYARGQTYESLVSRGPLKKNLEIMLFPAGHLAPASVSYSYTVNKDDHTLERTKYKWKFSKWSDCSVTCGTGIQTIMHKCMDKNEDAQVNNEMCSFLDQPRQDQATCHRGSCDQIRYIWAMFRNFTECSETCGENGIKVQEYGCERNYPNGTTEYVERYLCEENPAPYETAPCNRVPCEVDFRYSWLMFNSYLECSHTCGDAGVGLKEFECERIYPNNTSEYVDHHFCGEDTAPREEIKCNRIPCPTDFTYEWQVFDTDCSATCGDDGFYVREYACEKHHPDGNIEYVDHSFCRGSSASNDKIPCNRVPCPQEHRYSWLMLDTFTECSETCGDSGVQRQHYECVREVDKEYVEHRFCVDVPAPNVTQACNRVPCDEEFHFEWVMYDTYTECSQTCGEDGVKVQEYGCEKLYNDDTAEFVDDYFCMEELPPEEVALPCNRVACAPEFSYQWAMLDTYTECSHTCGEDGIKTQDYGCEKTFTDGSVEIVDDYFCSDDLPPEEVIVPCNIIPCAPDFTYKWVLFDTYTECSQPCGEDGTQTKEYGCEKQYSGGTTEDVDENFCKGPPPSRETIQCNRFSCNEEFTYGWFIFDTYTECSETCGEHGYQIQEYVCEKQYTDDTIEDVDDYFCADEPAPNVTLPCNRFPCTPDFTYSWVVYDTYSECSHSCGEDGTQSAEYGCEKHYSDNTAEPVDDYFCDDLYPAIEPVPCNRFPCVRDFTYRWFMFDTFSECSETCGESGVQTQDYGCERLYMNDTTEHVDNIFCEASLQPNETVPCNRFPCVLDFRYKWSMFESYSDCTETCGEEGIQFQHYGCEKSYPNGTTEYVEDGFCEKIKPPIKKLECNRFPCLLEWTVGEWSECSATCGMGVQTREVFCGDPIDWDENDVCVEDIPTPEKICNRGPCIPQEPPSCKEDKYAFCKYASLKKCRFGGFRKMCCKSCFKGAGAAAYRRWTRMVRQKRRLRIKRRLKAKRRENRILKYN